MNVYRISLAGMCPNDSTIASTGKTSRSVQSATTPPSAAMIGVVSVTMDATSSGNSDAYISARLPPMQ